HLVGIDSALADPVLVHMHHDSMGAFVVLVEEALEHVHHELHRRVVVVEQQHAIERRPLGLRLGLGDDRGARRSGGAALVVVLVGQARRRRRAWKRFDGATLLGRRSFGRSYGIYRVHGDFTDQRGLWISAATAGMTKITTRRVHHNDGAA